MRVITLGDLCDIVSGGTPARSNPEFWNGGTIPWIKIGNIKQKYVNEADEFITQAGLDGSSAKMLQKGTLLYTIFATLGDVGILNIDACTNQAIAGITIKDTKTVLPEYLYYYLHSKKKYVNDIGRGVAQNNINMTILRSFKVPLPELSEQKTIVELLDRVAQIINARQQQVAALDDLIKARFVEMFGDPECNPKGWKKESLKNHADVLVGYPFPSEGYAEKGTPIVGGYNLMHGFIQWDSSKYWPDIQGYEQYLLCDNDIVMAMDRPWVNGGFKIAQVEAKNLSALLIQRTARIRAKDMEQSFVYTLLDTPQFAKHCNITGSLVPHISNKDINSFEIIIPPNDMQKAFSAFVAQIDKSKFAVQIIIKFCKKAATYLLRRADCVQF